MAITAADYANYLEPTLSKIWNDTADALSYSIPFKLEEPKMTLYEFVIVSKPKKKKKTPKILEGPELMYAESIEDLKSELYYEGNDPKEVDILVRPF